MKHIYKLFLIFFIISALCGCNEEYTKENTKCSAGLKKCMDLNGKPITGRLKLYYPNGNLALDGLYKDGIPNGVSKMYYENGKIQAELTLSNNGKDEDNKMYYENGKIQAEVIIKNGKLHGINKEYYENGNLKDEISYKNGKRDGLRKMYYENGKLKAIGSFKNDEKEGIFKDYNEDGSLQKEITYQNDRRTTPDEKCIEERNSQRNFIWVQCINTNVNPSYLTAFEQAEGVKKCQYLMDHLYDPCYE